jgi:hypothetical protein
MSAISIRKWMDLNEPVTAAHRNLVWWIHRAVDPGLRVIQ